MADSENPTPQPNFDFIMKEEPKPQRSVKMPSNIPKPLFIGGLVVLGIFLIIIVASIFGGGSGSSTEIYKLMSDASVIGVTSNEAVDTAAAPDTKAIAVTTTQSMASQQQVLQKYLATQRVKYDAKQVRTSPTATVTAALKGSQLNNTYDQTYLNYLKTSLAAYQTDLKAYYGQAGPKLKVIINDAYDSNAIILSSPQLK